MPVIRHGSESRNSKRKGNNNYEYKTKLGKEAVEEFEIPLFKKRIIKNKLVIEASVLQPDIFLFIFRHDFT